MEAHNEECLADILKKKDPTLYFHLEKIIERGLGDWMGLLSADKGSYTGYAHFRNVERIADQIIPGNLKIDLNAGELFLLLSAIYLHDIGKVIQYGKKTPCGKIPREHCFIDNKLINDPEKEMYVENVHPLCRKPQYNHHRV